MTDWGFEDYPNESLAELKQAFQILDNHNLPYGLDPNGLKEFYEEIEKRKL